MTMTKALKFLLPIVSLLLLPQIAFAGPFEPIPTDLSQHYLSKIFGSTMGAITLANAAYDPDSLSPTANLSGLFEILNTVVLTISVIIMTYIGIVSTINTAQEGTAMGKKWSAAWTPMKSLLGMLLMVPTYSSGYSTIQMTVMWFILQGVGAADRVWEKVLDDLASGIPAAGDIDIAADGKLSFDADGIAENLLNVAVCMASIEQLSLCPPAPATFDPNTMTISAECSDTAEPPGPVPATGDGGSRSDLFELYGSLIRSHIYSPSDPLEQNPRFHPNPIGMNTETVTASLDLHFGVPEVDNGLYETVCGKATLEATVNKSDFGDFAETTTPEQIRDKALELVLLKQAAIENVLNPLRNAADLIADLSMGPRDGYPVGALKETQPTPGGYMNNAEIAYVNTLLEGGLVPQKPEGWMASAIESGKQNGWIVAGAYYFVLQKAKSGQLFPTISDGSQIQFQNIPSCKESSCLRSTEEGTWYDLDEYITNDELQYIARRLADGYTYKTYDGTAGDVKLNINVKGAKGIDSSFAPLTKLMKDATKFIKKKFTGGGDPLLAQASFGSWLMQAAEYTWISVVLMSTLLSLGAAICASIQPGFSVMSQMVLTAMMTIIAICGMMWVFGATLGVYTPLIPYMLFTVAALGWYLLVIEAVIAAPILALAIISPGGEDLSSIKQGALILTGIFLRPSLMIFGFLIGARVYQVICLLINKGMFDVFDTISVGSMLAPLAAIALYAGLIMALANKCFALIYIIPDKVMRWIGGTPESTDVGAVEKAKGTMESASKQISGAAQGVTSGVAKKAKSYSDSKAKQGATAASAKKGGGGIKSGGGGGNKKGPGGGGGGGPGLKPQGGP